MCVFTEESGKFIVKIAYFLRVIYAALCKLENSLNEFTKNCSRTVIKIVKSLIGCWKVKEGNFYEKEENNERKFFQQKKIISFIKLPAHGITA